MRYLLVLLTVTFSAAALAQPNVCYSGKDEVFGIRFGSTKAELLSAMLHLGLRTDLPSDITCSRSKNNGSEETCDVNVESPAWQKIRPYPVLGDEHFTFALKDGLLIGSVQLLEFVSRGDAVDGYYKAKEAFAASYRKPGQNPGFWRRQFAKFGSSLVGAKFVNGATWNDETNTSAVVLLLGRPNTFLMLIHGKKGFEN